VDAFSDFGKGGLLPSQNIGVNKNIGFQIGIIDVVLGIFMILVIHSYRVSDHAILTPSPLPGD